MSAEERHNRRRSDNEAEPKDPLPITVNVFQESRRPGEFEIRLMQYIRFITAKVMKMTQQLDDLTREVSETKDVQQSAVTLLEGLKTQLDEAIAANQGGDNGAALAELSTQLDTSTNALAAAVARGGSAAPAPTPSPAPDAGTVELNPTNAPGTPGTNG